MSTFDLQFRNTILNFNTLTFASTQVLLFALFPYFADQMDLSLSMIALCFSIGTILFLWGSPFWTARSDRKGRSSIMTIGVFGLFFSFALMTLMTIYADKFSGMVPLIGLILSRLIYGSLASAIVPVAQASRGDQVKEGSYLKAMYAHSFTLSLGRTLGPVLLIIVPNIHSLLISLTIWCFLLFLGNVLLAEGKSKVKIAETKTNLKDTAKEISYPLLIAVIFTILTGLLHSSLGGTIQMAFSLESAESSKLMAKLLLMGSLLMALVQLAGRFLGNKNWKSTMTLGIFSLILGSTFFFFMTSTSLLWPAVAFISIGIALIQPSNIAMVHAMNSEGIGKKIGLLASGNTIGYALGGTLAAILLSVGAQAAPLILALLLGAVMLVTFKRVRL